MVRVGEGRLREESVWVAVPDFKGTGWHGHDGVKQNAGESAAGTGGSEPASLGQDVPGQPGRGAAPSSHQVGSRRDSGSWWGLNHQPDDGALSRLRTGARGTVRPEQVQPMPRGSSLGIRFPSSSATRMG